MKDYQPKPPNLSILDARPDLAPLIEDLAALIHDSWSAERIRQGWSYGETRNDELKHHPSLVPYDRLNEDDKELDRTTVRSTIAALLQLGYNVVR